MACAGSQGLRESGIERSPLLFVQHPPVPRPFRARSLSDRPPQPPATPRPAPAPPPHGRTRARTMCMHHRVATRCFMPTRHAAAPCATDSLLWPKLAGWTSHCPPPPRSTRANRQARRRGPSVLEANHGVAHMRSSGIGTAATSHIPGRAAVQHAGQQQQRQPAVGYLSIPWTPLRPPGSGYVKLLLPPAAFHLARPQHAGQVCAAAISDTHTPREAGSGSKGGGAAAAGPATHAQVDRWGRRGKGERGSVRWLRGRAGQLVA